MNDQTPEQAAAHAFVTGCVQRGITASMAAVPPEGQFATVRGLWADVAQAAVDAATEGSLRACGYTLADIARFLEAEAAEQEPQPAPENARKEFVAEITGALLAALGEDADAAPEPGESPERRAVRLAAYAKGRIDELHDMISAQEPQAAPGLAERLEAAAGRWLDRAAEHGRDAGRLENGYQSGYLNGKAVIYDALAAEVRELIGEPQ